MTGLAAPGNDSAQGWAGMILRDLKVFAGLSYPIDGKPPFSWLQPGFSNNIYRPLEERLDAGLKSLPPERRALAVQGLQTALSTAATQWCGAEVTLSLLDWAWTSAREWLSPRLLLTFVFHHDPFDPRDSAYWIGQLSRRYAAWQLNPMELAAAAKNIPAEQWSATALRSTMTDRVDVLCWILGFVREDANMAKKVRDAGVADLNAHADALPDFIVDWFDDVERPLARACGISGSTPNAEIAIELSRRAYLQAYSGDSEGDWPLQDDLVPEVRT